MKRSSNRGAKKASGSASSSRKPNSAKGIIESLESRVMLAADFNAIGALLDSHLLAANTSLGTIDTAKLPVVNQSLTQITQTKAFITSFESQLVTAVKGITSQQPSAIQAAIFQVLGPTGLGLLADANKDGSVTAADVSVVHPTGSTAQPDDLGIKFSLVSSQTDIGNTTVGNGLPSVPLTVTTGSVDRKLSFALDNLSFGWVSGHAYFGSTAPIIIPNAGGTLHVNLTAAFPQAIHFTGTMGFMPFMEDSNPLHPSQAALEADFTLPINSAGKITGATLTGTSTLQMGLKSTFESGLIAIPDLTATYLQTWNFNGGDANAVMLGSAPMVKINGVTADFGTLVSNLISPIADKLDKILSPIEPIIDVLTKPLPVLSDVSNLIGQGDVSLLTLVKLYEPEAAGFVDIIEELKPLIADVKALEAIKVAASAGLDFGSFDLTTDNPDLRTPSLKASTDYTQINLDTLTPNDASDVSNYIKIEQQIANIAGADDFSHFLKEDVSTGGDPDSPQAGAGFAFGLPILGTPDTGIFKVLMGQNVDLFTFNGYANASAPFNIASARVGPIAIKLNGSLTFNLNLDLGYDLNGVRTALSGTDPSGAANAMFQGFYLGSSSTDPTKNTAVSFTGGINATAGPDIVVFSLVIDGGLSATLGLFVNTDHQDPSLDDLKAHLYGDDHDPQRVREDELGGTLFDAKGSIGGSLSLDVKIGVKVPFIGFVGYEDSYKIAGGTLFSFDFGSIPDPFITPKPVTLAYVNDNGVLVLSAGENHSHLGDDDLYNGVDSEKFTVVQDPNNANGVLVSAYGFTQEYSGFSSIAAVAGDKALKVTIGAHLDSLDGTQAIDDTVALVGSAEDDTFVDNANGKVLLVGNLGNDDLEYYGSGDAVIYGDQVDPGDTVFGIAGGDDTIIGGGGNNTLYGGAGNDTINGGQRIRAGVGVNNIYGQEDNDTITGGLGNTNGIVGGQGDDNITAGDQNDVIFGDDLPDVRPQVSGNDTITAGVGLDSISGEGGDDQLNWEGSRTSTNLDNTTSTLPSDGIALFDGGAGNNSVSFLGSDQADTFTFKPGTDSQTNNPALGVFIQTKGVVFENVAALDLEGRGGADTIALPDLSGLGLQHVGIDLQDVVKLDKAKDIVTLAGTSLPDSVSVYNEGVGTQAIPHTGGRETTYTYEFGGITKVTGLAGLSEYDIRVANVSDSLTINTGGGDDGVFIYGVTGPTSINTNSGNDELTVQSDSFSVPLPNDPDTIPDPNQHPGPRFVGKLLLDAGTGANGFTFADFSTNTTVIQHFTNGVGLAYGNAVDDGVQFVATGGTFGHSVDIATGDGKDNVHIFDTTPDATTFVNTGAGNDTVLVGDGNETLAGVRNLLNVDGGADSNILELDNSGGTTGDSNVIINSTSVLNFAGVNGAQPVKYGASDGGTTFVALDGSNSSALKENFSINGPSGGVEIDGNAGDDNITVQRLAHQSTLNGGDGNDKLFLGHSVVINNRGAIAQTTDDITATIIWDGDAGTNGVFLDDRADTVGGGSFLESDVLDFDAVTVSLDHTQQLDIRTGSGDDTLNVLAKTPAALVVNFYAGGGTNNEGVTAIASTWELDAPNHVILNHNINLIGVQLIRGTEGTNTFRIDSGVTSGVSIVGTGNALSTLDYSLWTTSITADLKTGMATGLVSISGVDNVTGGSAGDFIRGNNDKNVINGLNGNDIIVGLDGGDSLVGGNGADVLIGGNGADILSGGANRDLLIDGSTAYDSQTNPFTIATTSLRTVQAQWASENVLVKPTIPTALLGANKLFHDSFIDRLTGGTDTDLFYYMATGRATDVLTDRVSTEPAGG